jgi:2-methylcitrate synthase
VSDSFLIPHTKHLHEMSKAKDAAPAYSPGLAGVIAGETAICTVGKKGMGLMYRGYSIVDLAAKCIFEEVAFLLIYGSLPTQAQLDQYSARLAKFRELPVPLKKALELIPANAHPMDVLKVGAAMLGTIRAESQTFTCYDVFDSLIASFGSMLCYWNHWHASGKRISTQGKPKDTVAQHFLRCLLQKEVKGFF